MITYSGDKKISLDQLLSLYESVGWSSYTSEPEVLKQAIDNSLSIITAWQGSQLVGLIRVVGDGVTILYIQDVLVRPTYQGQRIGSTLMEKILNDYKDVRQKVLLTEESSVNRSFYEGLKFISCDKGEIVAFYKEY